MHIIYWISADVGLPRGPPDQGPLIVMARLGVNIEIGRVGTSLGRLQEQIRKNLKSKYAKEFEERIRKNLKSEYTRI
jgi:hypothetical protein